MGLDRAILFVLACVGGPTVRAGPLAVHISAKNRVSCSGHGCWFSPACFVQHGERHRTTTRRGATSKSAEAVDAALQRLLVLCTALQQPPGPADLEPQLIARATASSFAARSEVHGDGLFARADLAPGEVAALYPVHAVGIVGLLREGEAHQLCMSADAEHFGSRGASGYRQYAPLGPRSRARAPWLAPWSDALFVVANPHRRAREPPGSSWLGHLVNDGATMRRATSDDAAIETYAAASAEARNVVAVALDGAAPLVALVTTRAVPEGAELFATYEHRYWLRRAGLTPPPPTPLVRELDVAAAAREAEAAAAVEAAYPEELAELRAIFEEAGDSDEETEASKRRARARSARRRSRRR